GSQVPARGVDERFRNQPQCLETRPVTTQRGFILCTALHVFEDEMRDAGPGHRAEVRNVQSTRDIATVEGAPFPGHTSSEDRYFDVGGYEMTCTVVLARRDQLGHGVHGACEVLNALRE